MAYSFKSSISFGLVYIPITLYAAVKNNDISFNQLDKKTRSRIKYVKTCALCGGNLVKQEDVVKGFEYEKGKYVLFNDADFEKIKTKNDKTISIKQFVNLSEIDPIFYDRAFYVVPEKTATKAFGLLAKAMEKEGKVGIAKTVLGSKETVVAMRVKNKQMILNTMFFYEEIQQSPAHEIEVQTNEKEFDLVKMIISNMASKFEPQKFKDEYRERLYNAIQAKIKGQEIAAADDGKKERKIASLMDALKESLEKTAKKHAAVKPKIKKAN